MNERKKDNYSRSSCFVPGCKTGYTSDRKICKLQGKQNPSLFRPPKHMLEKWNSVIQRQDRPLTRKDVVCSLHFKEEDVQRYYSTVVNKKEVFIKRGVPRLKEGAVPCIFFNNIHKGLQALRTRRALRREMNRNLRASEKLLEKKIRLAIERKEAQRKEMALSQNTKRQVVFSPPNSKINGNILTLNKNSMPHLKKRGGKYKVAEDGDNGEEIEKENPVPSITGEIGSVKEEYMNQVTVCEPVIELDEYQSSEYCYVSSDSRSNTPEINENACYLSTALNGTSCRSNYKHSQNSPNVDKSLDVKVSSFTYSDLLTGTNKIQLPSSLWAVQKHPQGKYVAFFLATFASAKGVQVDRSVVFEGTCKPIVFFHGHKIPPPDGSKEMTSLKDVRDLLQSVDEIHAILFIEENGE